VCAFFQGSETKSPEPDGTPGKGEFFQNIKSDGEASEKNTTKSRELQYRAGIRGQGQNARTETIRHFEPAGE